MLSPISQWGKLCLNLIIYQLFRKDKQKKWYHILAVQRQVWLAAKRSLSSEVADVSVQLTHTHTH